jgi:hypothetical protein
MDDDDHDAMITRRLRHTHRRKFTLSLYLALVLFLHHRRKEHRKVEGRMGGLSTTPPALKYGVQDEEGKGNTLVTEL